MQEQLREKLSDIINYTSHCNINCILGIWPEIVRAIGNAMLSWISDVIK